MTAYPVHYAVTRPMRFTRLQLVIRVIAFCALGVLGLSFGMVFVFAYLALPVYAATRLSAGRDPAAYVADDGPRVLRGLRWLAAVSAWAGLIVEHLPVHEAAESVTLEIEGAAHPTSGHAMWRVVTGIPSAFVLGLLCWFGVLVWLWAALSILATQRIGDHTFHYLEGLQRWSLRLLAYQASLVDEYPPFSFSDAHVVLPPARVAH
jgi:Domain of unknown function (DUF4389)